MTRRTPSVDLSQGSLLDGDPIAVADSGPVQAGKPGPVPATEPGPAFGDGPVTEVYTDGACRGNPGRGGWAWAVDGGPWGSGSKPLTTNQRMEVLAVIEALRSLPGPVHVVSDST
ncbi:MAG TPA: RNase H family protein, partial [Acidimicrobiales bacterium]